MTTKIIQQMAEAMKQRLFSKEMLPANGKYFEWQAQAAFACIEPVLRQCEEALVTADKIISTKNYTKIRDALEELRDLLGDGERE